MQGFLLFLKNKKNLVSLTLLLALIFAIPLGIYLARNTQIFRPRAEVEGIISLAEGNCVKTINGERVLTCKDVPLKLINPFGSPVATSSASPSPPASSSASPSHSVSPSPSPDSQEKVIILVTDSFDPSKLKIKAGTTVIWRNNSSNPQNLTPHKDLFPPQDLEPGQEFSFIFTSKGNFRIDNKLSNKKNNIKVTKEK